MTTYEKHTPRATFVLELHDDGTLTEYEPDTPEDAWDGTWEEEWLSWEKVRGLRLTIGDIQSLVILDLIDGAYRGTEAEGIPISLVPVQG